MKIAVCGKGGVGKTTISGLLCRVLGSSGSSVLAIDGDPNPNLGHILGIENSDASTPQLTTKLMDIVEEMGGRKYTKLNTPLAEIIDTYGLKTPDNVTLLAVGQPDHAGDDQQQWRYRSELPRDHPDQYQQQHADAFLHLLEQQRRGPAGQGG